MSEVATSPVLGTEGGSVEPAETVQPASPAVAEPGSPSTAEPTTITREMLLSAIPETIRGEAVFQNINEENPIADMAGQFLNAQRLIGVDKIPAPKADWTPEQWGQFWERAGRPQSIDGYTLPETELSFDEGALNAFREIAHEEGLTGKQFQRIMAHYAELSQGALAQQDAAVQEQIKNGLMGLQKEWGGNYDENLAMADRFLQNYDDPSLLELVRNDKALQNNPAIIKLFHRLALDTQEAAIRTGDSTNPAVINSAEQAQAALKKFEMDNREMLFKRREEIRPDERSRLDDLLERRRKLYELAYPSED